MNLKEEILKKADGRTVISITAAAVIADSYAKEKAWEAILAFKYTKERITKEELEKWWEENK